jgi:hypothetical protein
MLEYSQFTEYKASKKVLGYIWIFTFISLVYMMNMLITVRIHYTVDVIAGLLFSIFIYQLMSKGVKYCDMLGNLPYLVFGRPVVKFIQKKRRKIKI